MTGTRGDGNLTAVESDTIDANNRRLLTSGSAFNRTVYEYLQ